MYIIIKNCIAFLNVCRYNVFPFDVGKNQASEWKERKGQTCELRAWNSLVCRKEIMTSMRIIKVEKGKKGSKDGHASIACWTLRWLKKLRFSFTEIVKKTKKHRVAHCFGLRWITEMTKTWSNRNSSSQYCHRRQNLQI